MHCTTEEGGLNRDDITLLAKELAASRHLVGIDIVEFNPEIMPSEAARCAQLCSDIIEILLCGKATLSLTGAA